MNINFNDYKEKGLQTFLVFCTFFYPLLFIWQGIDLTDTGYHATNQHFFFEMLNDGTGNSMIFISNLIGAIWLKIFPYSGLFGLKILYLLFLYGIILLSYRILKQFCNEQNLIWMGLFIGLIYSTRFSPFNFNYDIASCFFLLSTVYSLALYLKNQSPIALMLSACLFSLSVLARFPNIVFIVLLPGIFLIGNNFKIDRKTSFSYLKQFTYFGIGFVFTTLFFILILWATSTLDSFLNGYSFLEKVVENRSDTIKSSHSFSALLLKNLNDLKVFLRTELKVLISIILGVTMLSLSNKIKWLKFFYLLFIVVLFYFLFQETKSLGYGSKLKYLAPAILAPLCLYAFRYDKKLRTLIYLILVFGMTQIAGTNTGVFLKLNYTHLLLFPLGLIIANKLRIKDILDYKINLKALFLLLIACTALFSLYNRFAYIYQDGKGHTIRLEYIYPVKGIPQLAYNYTKAKASKEISEIVSAIQQHVGQNDRLYVYGHKPLLYYLTNNKPAIKEMWLSGNKYEAKIVFNALQNTVKESYSMPVIVDTKQKVLGKEGEELLHKFLTRNKYQKMHAGEEFDLWKRVTE